MASRFDKYVGDTPPTESYNRFAKYVETDKQEPQSANTSWNRTIGDQFLQGATFNTSDEIRAGIGSAYAKGSDLFRSDQDKLFADKSIGSLYDESLSNERADLRAQFEESPVLSIGANIAGGLATGAAAASTKAGTAIANSIGRGLLPEATGFLGKTANAATKVLQAGATGAASGGAYSFGSGEGGFDNRIQDAEQGAILGGAVGVAAPVIAGTASKIKSAILPQVDETVRGLADKAINTYGIPLKRSQIGDSRFAKTLASSAEKIPLTGAVKFDSKVHKAFNRAVMKTIGEDVDTVTPQVIKSAYRNIGKKFDDALGGQTIQVGDEALTKLATIESNASSDITKAHSRIVQNQIKKFLDDVAEDGTISGEKIGSFRSRLTHILNTTRNDASPFLKKLQDWVVDVSVDGSPARRDMLNQARLQYKNLKTIEPLAGKAVKGNLQPSLLLSRVMSKFKDFPSGGGGELGDLARIGQTFLKDTVPNSGTPERLMAYGAMFGLPSAALMAPAIATKAATGIGGAALYNAMNRSQPLVRAALRRTGKSLPKSNLRAPLIEGEAASMLERR